MEYKKPVRLQKGDSVAIVSPSWGGPNAFPHIYEHGLKILKEWGLKVREFPTARTDAASLRAHPEMRAKDINDAFADPQIKAVFATIGGNDSIRILPFIDREILKNNPKILMGYSDTTTLHTLLSQVGVVSLYGPSLMAGFSQMESLPPTFKSHVHEFLFEPKDTYEYQTYGIYSDGYPEWSLPENLGKVNPLQKDEGWRWLQGSAAVQGELFGGCIEVLQMMKGTPFWPSPDFWDGKIFFLETSENKPSIHHIDHELRNYGAMGLFERITGLVLARARDFSEKEKQDLEKKIVSIVADEFGKPDLPIVANVDFGHTDPQLVLPLGVKAKLDPVNKTFALVESWLS